MHPNTFIWTPNGYFLASFHSTYSSLLFLLPISHPFKTIPQQLFAVLSTIILIAAECRTGKMIISIFRPWSTHRLLPYNIILIRCTLYRAKMSLPSFLGRLRRSIAIGVLRKGRVCVVVHFSGEFQRLNVRRRFLIALVHPQRLTARLSLVYFLVAESSNIC